jgi:hypothetical protein
MRLCPCRTHRCILYFFFQKVKGENEQKGETDFFTKITLSIKSALMLLLIPNFQYPISNKNSNVQFQNVQTARSIFDILSLDIFLEIRNWIRQLADEIYFSPLPFCPYKKSNRNDGRFFILYLADRSRGSLGRMGRLPPA